MNIPCFSLSRVFNAKQLWMLGFISFHSAVCWFLSCPALSHSNIVFSKNMARATRTYLTECRWSSSWCVYRITGDQKYMNTWKLILHQVSSIFSGSGSLDKCSPDTRKMVCTSRPHGGLYERRRLRSPPASHLQTKDRRGFTVDSCITFPTNLCVYTVARPLKK